MRPSIEGRPTRSDGIRHNGRVSFSQADLSNALHQCAQYVDTLEWGSPDLLFALVPTAVLAQQAPDLVDADDPSALSPVLQEPEDPTASTQDLLATVAWPDAVVGCALATQINVVQPDALDTEGQPARLFAGVLRTGSRVALLQMKGEDGLRTHPDLAPDLLDALAATFE